MLFLFVAVRRPSSNFALLSGATLALANIAVPAIVWLIPLFGLPLFFERYPLRARVHLVASTLLGFALPTIAWGLRHV
ncbi:MAG TPA: hypothetical protein VMQ61_09165 [Thermoanaerobaculia bacterium]|nr:hypothetical protein [Thermoanaerobaculia bacterium]